MKKNFLILAIPFASLLLMQCQGPSATNVRPAELFTDDAVLQRGKEIVVWGTADPGGTVEVELGEAEVQGEVDAQGKWRVTLPAMDAGGPYELEIEGAEEIKLENIMVGDVWLASGQSNMEWALQSTVDNFEEEIANADYPDIRLFTVERRTSYTPLDSMTVAGGGWVPCSPETAPAFSAVAYFFGRQIHQEEGVAVGLISSNWGGTVAEAWTSEEMLMTMPDFASEVKQRQQADQEAVSPEVAEQQRIAIIEAANKKISATDYQPALNLEDGKTMTLPNLWESADTALQNFDGFVWFQKTINLPGRYAGKALTLHLGAIDDDDITWFNGQRVGETQGYTKNRTYELPAEAVKSGENTIIVRVQDNGGGGGIYGPTEEMYLEQNGQKLSVDLAGSWQYDVSQEPPLPASGGLQNQPATLYNGMIAPLLPYPIKGVIWYQGESNASRAQQYATLFPNMIKDWRTQWKYDFPFLFVQLANFESGGPYDQWPYLREAQNQALKLENTGMAVTIDIGDSVDIHPRNKQDVGDRLARAALAVAYGDASNFTGPMYESMRVAGDSVIITFKGVDNGLMKLPDEEVMGFTIAEEGKPFVEASATIIGPNEISVWAAGVSKPVAVRYGWADNPTVNLYSEDGLPVSPFRTDSRVPGDDITL